MIKILIADDQTLMRDGLSTIIELEDDMEVVAEAPNGLLAYEKSCELLPDVILMDIQMPLMDGVEATRIIKKAHSQISIIMLTTFENDQYVLEALKHGANGYLLKSINSETLISSIRDCVNGVFSMSSNLTDIIARRLGEMPCAQKSFCIKDLPERESKVAQLLTQGLSNRQISERLYISEGTVKNYISSIYEKIGCNDRVKVVEILRKS